MTTRPGPTITRAQDPPGFFQVRSTGTIHLVRYVDAVTWPNGPHHLSVTFWCDNVMVSDRGDLSSNRPYTGIDCRACRAHHDRPRRSLRRRV